jgi:Flp pilus assembly protein TadG
LLAAPARRDVGAVTAVESMFVLAFLVVSLAFVTGVGRLHAAGVEVHDATSAAARTASMARNPSAGRDAALDAVASSSLARRCGGAPSVTFDWSPASGLGTWQGGSVTVRVSCRVPVQQLSGMWTPGSTTVSSTVTHPIDRYQR